MLNEIEYSTDAEDSDVTIEPPSVPGPYKPEEHAVEYLPQLERHEFGHDLNDGENEHRNPVVEAPGESGIDAATEMDDGFDDFDDDGEPYVYKPALTKVERFIQAVLSQVPADADDGYRLGACSLIAVRDFNAIPEDEYAPAMIVDNAEQLRFLRRPDWTDVAAALRNVQWRLQLLDVSDILGMLSPSQLKAESWGMNDLIAGVIPAGQVGTLSGPKNALKTKIGIDLCISLATGTDFLDHFPIDTPVRAGIIAGEDSPGDIDEAIDRICRAKGVDRKALDGQFFVAPRVPSLRDEYWLTAARRFIELSGLEYLCIEAGYLGLGGADQRSLQAMGHALAPIKQLCDDTGCTIQNAVHTTYSSSSSSGWPVLNDIAGVGYEELARFWFLLKSVLKWDPTTGQHRLRLVIGNKRSERRYLLDVREGHVDDPGGRVWEPKITEPGRDSTGKLQEQIGRKLRPAQKLEQYKVAVCELLKKHPEGLSKSALGSKAGVPEKQRSKVIKALLASGEIELAPITISNQKTPRDGYRLRRTS